jgi:hypothetical protein
VDAVGRLSLNPPASSSRARSASHSSALPTPAIPAPNASGSQTSRGQHNAGRSLPPAPGRPPHPQNPSVSIPSHTPSSFTLAPPSLSPPPGQAPPSPSLMVDSATKERRAQVKKDLASIITKPPNPHPHPGGNTPVNTESFGATEPFLVSFPPSQTVPAQPTQPRPMGDRRSISFEFDQLNSKLSSTSVACPICNDSFQNERVLAVHIDDAHGLGSVIGPNASGKKVHFATGNQRNSGGPASVERTPTKNPLNSSIDALDLSFASPLGKSRSVDDIHNRPAKKVDESFGFEGFGMVQKSNQLDRPTKR